MELDDVMETLRGLGNESVRRRSVNQGADPTQFGVKLGDIRTLAKRLKTNPELASALWQTGNSDARLLATLLMRPSQLTTDELEVLVLSATYPQLADWLGAYVVKLHPQKEHLRQPWMDSESDTTRRAGWSLTAERIVKNPEGLELGALLDRIETELGEAPAFVQWTMNFCLAEIGIHFPEHRTRALAIGERLGVFRDYPTAKGCTSPFAPIWITELVKRKAAAAA